MNLLDKFHFKDKKTGIVTTMEICDSFSRNKITEVVGMIPTKTSDLQNDSGFITSASVPTKTSELQNDSGFITSAAVPIKTSDLQNDSGFITAANIPSNVSAFNNDAGYIKESIGVGTPFRKIKVGDLAITHGMTASENYPITNSAGSLYYYDKTISIPANARLSTLYNVNVTPLGGIGCIGAMVTAVTTSSITIRVFNNTSATVALRMNITMFGE